MAKDPAALFFIDKWLVATAEMNADCRGWFLNLILHQFDKGDLPPGIEELASLAQVKFSEYPRFEQVFEQVLKHKFEQKPNGRIENPFAKEIIQSRKLFKEKREGAGRMSYFIRYCRKHFCQDENVLFFVKKHVDLSNVDLQNEHMLEQVFKQTSELFINGDVNVNINKGEEDKGQGKEEGEKETTLPGPKIDTGAKVLIVPELKAVWMKHRRTYQFEMMKDAQPLRLIGEAIAKGENVSAYEVAGIDQIKQTFEAIVEWSLTHSLYKNFQLSQFEKYFQTICEAFRNKNDGSYGTNVGPKSQASILQNNMQTAQRATELVKRKYGRTA